MVPRMRNPWRLELYYKIAKGFLFQSSVIFYRNDLLHFGWHFSSFQSHNNNQSKCSKMVTYESNFSRTCSQYRVKGTGYTQAVTKPPVPASCWAGPGSQGVKEGHQPVALLPAKSSRCHLLGRCWAPTLKEQPSSVHYYCLDSATSCKIKKPKTQKKKTCISY